MAASVTAVADKCEPDGSHEVIITTAEDKEIVVTIPLAQLERLIRCFQEAAILRANAANENISVPELTVAGVHLAHSGPRCELMVSTVQMGTIVLVASDDLLRHIKVEVDRVLSYRGGPRSSN